LHALDPASRGAGIQTLPISIPPHIVNMLHGKICDNERQCDFENNDRKPDMESELAFLTKRQAEKQ
jgi:hypothetical protein